MEDSDLNDRKFKMAVIKKLNEIQEKSGSSMSSVTKLMNSINEMKMH